MKAKTPVRWISNRQEGSSENWFIDLFISPQRCAIYSPHRLDSLWAVLPVSKSENVTAG